MADDVALSDWDIFDEISEPLMRADTTTLDSLYESFLPIAEARDAAFRQMLLGGAIAFLSTFGILTSTGNTIVGLSIAPQYFAVAAVAYATICFLRVTNIDLKYRLYARLFRRRFEQSDRAAITLRYPAAFPGSHFIATTFVRRDSIAGWRQVVSNAGLVVLILATVGVAFALWAKMLLYLWSSPDTCGLRFATAPAGARGELAYHVCIVAARQTAAIVRTVIVAHIIAIVAVQLIHRNPKVKRRYTRITEGGA